MFDRLLLLTALATFVRAKTPDNVTSRLMIHIPHSLYKKEGYDHREALFGIPPYGGSIAQNVYYAEAELCDSNVDTSTGVPKREIKDGKMAPWPAPFILMVDRGGCTFAKKVRNAQRAGAAAVLIADTTCLCTDEQCVKQNSQPCENAEPIMADDGSGGDVSIPSFLMFKRDADSVKDELKQDHPVQIEMSWALPNPDDRVEYDLWTVPSDPVSLDFLKNFKTAAVALGKSAYFTPHSYIYDGKKSNCVGNDSQDTLPCYNLCTNRGRYCATDPDNDLEKGISGADVVKESLRRMCIWKTYGDDGIGEKWWDYVTKFIELCNTPERFMNDDCVKDAYRRSGVNGDEIASCMKISGGLTENTANVILETEIKSQAERGVVVLPTAFVNSAAIRGALSVNNVFSAICAGFATGTAPTICKQCASCSNQQDCIKANGVCATHANQAAPAGSVSKPTFLFSLLLVTGLFAGLGIWHYKRTREEMREQVRGILAEYMPLEDNDDGTSPMDFARRGAATSLIS